MSHEKQRSVELSDDGRRRNPFQSSIMVRIQNFVVSADKVDYSMEFSWELNMQVKMTVETQEFSAVAWFQGAITDIDSHRDSHGTGFTFPWHMLQVYIHMIAWPFLGAVIRLLY